MSFVVEKDIGGGNHHAFHQYEKDKCMKHYGQTSNLVF